MLRLLVSVVILHWNAIENSKKCVWANTSTSMNSYRCLYGSFDKTMRPAIFSTIPDNLNCKNCLGKWRQKRMNEIGLIKLSSLLRILFTYLFVGWFSSLFFISFIHSLYLCCHVLLSMQSTDICYAVEYIWRFFSPSLTGHINKNGCQLRTHTHIHTYPSNRRKNIFYVKYSTHFGHE